MPFLIRSTPRENFLEVLGPNEANVHYSVPEEDDFAGVTFYLGAGGMDFSNVTNAVIGIESADLSKVLVEIEDTDRRRGFFYLTDIVDSRQYYEMPIAQLAKDLDLSKVTVINFIVDDSLLSSEERTGNFTAELGEFFGAPNQENPSPGR